MHTLMLRVLVFIAYQPYARAPNTYWNYIFVFKFEQSSYLFLLKNSRSCRDLNLGPPRYQADMLPMLNSSYPGLDGSKQLTKIEFFSHSDPACRQFCSQYFH